MAVFGAVDPRPNKVYSQAWELKREEGCLVLSIATSRTGSCSSAHGGYVYKWLGYLIARGRLNSKSKSYIQSLGAKRHPISMRYRPE